MIYSMAPMEGFTGHVFRRVHAAHFGVLDCYYTPFLAPPHLGCPFVGRGLKEIDPAANEGLNVIPQLLTNRADEFVWATQLLSDMGYREVNLNLGCPSGTVVSKGGGSGFLRDLDRLEAFLCDICERSALPVSVKTRLGLEGDAEYERILDVCCRMPLAQPIVHPRIQHDRYQGSPRWEPYGRTLERAPFPVAYNGDVFCAADVDALVDAYPATRHVMLGRGLLSNPALARQARGGLPITPSELRRFHDDLFGAYEAEIGGNAVLRMKEWWFYAKYTFADPSAVHRAVRKTRSVEDYLRAVERVFGARRWRQSSSFARRGSEAYRRPPCVTSLICIPICHRSSVFCAIAFWRRMCGGALCSSRSSRCLRRLRGSMWRLRSMGTCCMWWMWCKVPDWRRRLR